MKKLLLLLMSVIVALNAKALPYERDFRLMKFQTGNEYQQYVGARVKFHPSNEKKWKFNGSYDDVYIIKSIKCQEFVENYGSRDRNIKINMTFQQEKGKKKFSVLFYMDYYAKLFSETLPQYRLPIYLFDEYEKFRTKYLNKELKNTDTNEKYKIVDINYLASEEGDYSLYLTEENLTTGKWTNIPYKELDAGSYVSSLAKVEKPVDETIRYGETKVITEDGITKYSYSDNVIDIVIVGGSEEFNFSLKNVSDQSLKLVWNEAAFIDFDGKTSKIMHVGTKFIDREKDQPATTIIKGAKIEDVATPTCNVFLQEGRYGGWKTTSMYPKKPGLSPGQLKLMLPIQIKDIINEYVFVFDVKYSYLHPELLNISLNN
ncbi:MAG: hypothetical protein SPI18_10550 [Prevotella sp.]|nr:hypothetical protein [Prevotella sp.]